jgi:hypothetical protein
MVDFNADATITTPAADVIKILILQRRNDFIEASESYLKAEFSGTSTEIDILKARLYSLFYELQAALKRHYKPTEYEKIIKNIRSDDYENIMKAFFKINEWLDYMKLIRVDTKQRYDSTRVEKENTIKLK